MPRIYARASKFGSMCSGRRGSNSLPSPWQLEAHEITGVSIELPWSPLVITEHH